MTDPALLRHRLARSARQIAEREERLTRQGLLVARLRAEAGDARAAETLLLAMLDALERRRQEHGEILREIALAARRDEPGARD